VILLEKQNTAEKKLIPNGKIIKALFTRPSETNIHSEAIADDEAEEKEGKCNDFEREKKTPKIPRMLPFHIFITEYFYHF
jgi:hypothetical protein